MVRQLGSKLLAGGLSAGVVLLWWPMFFPTDSVTMWLGRGIVWTLSFELLLVALSPFELALWSTHRGERITQRVVAKRALLEHPSPKRRIGRRAALAMGALAVPIMLIVVGVTSHFPTVHKAAAPDITRVTRVVRVVKPVRVQRVVKIRTVAEQVPTQVTYPPATSSPRDIPRKAPAHTAKPSPQKPSSTPKAQANPPSSTPSTPTTQTEAPSTASPQPTPAPSGATAQPTT
ncbi:MAG TPA: hypothetical protein VJU60_07175 [Thermoleophilaceae bacterium]|nr:hypothetical protein [Thermoleophilaceae bacterium]